MSSYLFKKAILPVLAIVAISFCGSIASAAADPAAKNLSKSDVEQIIHDYLLNNPELILNSVDDYQKKSARSTQGAALEKNKDTLFKDSDSPEVGNPKGDVTVVEFMDYNCHYCKLSMPIVLSLLEKDKNIRVVFKDFPILGPTSETAAKWALAAKKQKKYFEFHKLLMNNKTPISDGLLEKIAKSLEMNLEQAKKDADGTETLLQIEKNRTLASSLGLSGTPAFIIGDDVSFGALSLEEMEKKISEERGKKDKK
jgi:protein-disulfide isomerase